MRLVLTVLLVMAVSTVTFAQADQRPRPEPEKPPEQRQIVDLPLPKRGFIPKRPRVTMQRALKLAESYIAKEKIDISPYYLYQATRIFYGDKESRESCWFFWWVNGNGAPGAYVEIIVSTETGNVRRLASM